MDIYHNIANFALQPYKNMIYRKDIWSKISCMIKNDELLQFLISYQTNNIYICGGCIRNIILQKETEIKDIDLFIDASPNEFDKFIHKISQYGIVKYGQYGSPRFFSKDTEQQYIDIVPFFNFIVSPEPVKSIIDLLCNFDFTANALGINIRTKEFFDPTNGLKDINNKVLRAVRLDFSEQLISKEIPISALSVFWFRLINYQAKLGFTFSSETLNWICKNKYRYADLKLFETFFYKPQISDEFKIRCLKE